MEVNVDTAGPGRRVVSAADRASLPLSVLVLAGSLGEIDDGGVVRALDREPSVERIEVLALVGNDDAGCIDGAPRAEVVDDLLPGSTRWLRRARISRATEAVRGYALRRRLREHDGPVVVIGRGARLVHWLPVANRQVVAWVPQFGGLEDLTESDGRALKAHNPRWVVGSPRVAAAVEALTGVPRSSVEVLADPWPGGGLQPIDARHERPSVRRRLAEDVGINVDAPLVCSGGPFDLATTGDAFIQLAWELGLRSEAADLAFGWLPQTQSDRYGAAFVHDLRAVGMERRVRVLPDLDPLLLAAAADVYVIAGRGPSALRSYRRAVTVGCPVVWFAQPSLDAIADPAHGAEIEPFDLGAMGDAVLALVRAPNPVIDDGAFGSRLLRHLAPA